MESNVAELKVNGSYYGGWTALQVSRSIEQIAGAFALEFTDRWSGQAQSLPIREGQACEVLLGGDRVISGYVDDADSEFDAHIRSTRVTGRDKTADLVDCSAVFKSGQWRGVKLDILARDLLTHFGIGVKVETDVGEAFSSFSIEQGETVFECLERAARLRAVLLVSDTAGNLVITRAGSTVVPVGLEEGRNILSGHATFSWKDRHSRYVVKAQAHATDDFYGSQAAAQNGIVDDGEITRWRPLVVLAEDHGSGLSLEGRAEWERNVRAGRGKRGTITVQGWRRPDGVIWQPNTMVSVKAPSLDLDGQMLIVGCSWRLDERGTTTELTIGRREAFDLLSGIGRSKLKQRLNHKMEVEKHKKGDRWSPPGISGSEPAGAG